jgi:hypothetical protein
MGSEPSHPELLDWLAREFIRRNWSMKQLHRLIVTSATYRQASRPTEPGWTNEQCEAARTNWELSKTADPTNDLLARFPRRRLAGEAIRDAMFATAGLLNRKRGGLGVMPSLPDELQKTLLKNQWKVTPNSAEHNRRSIYIFARRNLRYPILDVFDRPDANASCPSRNRSTTAPQSLLMLNSEFSLSMAQQMARHLIDDAGHNETAIVANAFRRAFGRPPTPDERQIFAEYTHVDTQKRSARFSHTNVTSLCLALYNCSEFVYID